MQKFGTCRDERDRIAYGNSGNSVTRDGNPEMRRLRLRCEPLPVSKRLVGATPPADVPTAADALAVDRDHPTRLIALHARRVGRPACRRPDRDDTVQLGGMDRLQDPVAGGRRPRLGRAPIVGVRSRAIRRCDV